MKRIIYAFISILVLATSCQDKKIKRSGKLDISLLVYSNPTEDPYDMFVLPISTMYFEKNNFLEIVQKYDKGLPIGQSFALVNKDKYAVFEDLNSISEVKPNLLVKDKNIGVKFINDIVDYKRKENLTDTILSGMKYKRARIVSDSAYTVFYIHQTDTVLPFSLSPQFDKDYKGVLNRIDTYEKYHNRFTSLRLSVSDTIPKQYYNALKQVKQ